MKREKRAAIYTRVSTTDQDTESQRHECLERVRYAGWKLAGEFDDVGASGKRDRRPALDKLMDGIRRRQFDVVIVWRSDRLFRSLAHMVRTFQEMTDLGVAFVSVKEAWDTTTSTGRLMLHVVAAFAQFERELTSERTRATMASKKRRGERIGRPKTRIDVDRFLALVESGLSRRAAAAKLGASRETIERAIKRERGTDGK